MATVPPRIVLASANRKKAAELDRILRDRLGDGVELVPRPPDVPEVAEDAPDFLGNARLKAVALVEATGEPALADDSGLEVDALGGAPGVRSARFAGDSASDADNVERLLAELGRLGVHGSVACTARFRCVLVLRWPDGTELVAEGSVEGHICDEPVGDAGFGYDPVFVPTDGDGRTFAQMSSDEKRQLSHRGQALDRLVASLAR